MTNKFRKIDLKTFPSKGYNLTPVEFKDVAPFEVKRAYYFQNLSAGGETGQHCHHEEQEVFVVVKGEITMILDKGQGKEDLKLKGPSDAVYVPTYVWHGFKEASLDCVVLALSSTNYRADRSDYIENYEEYLKIRDEKLK